MDLKFCVIRFEIRIYLVRTDSAVIMSESIFDSTKEIRQSESLTTLGGREQCAQILLVHFDALSSPS